MKLLLDDIAQESAFDAVREAVSSLLDRCSSGTTGDVITTSGILLVLTKGGAGANSQLIRSAKTRLLTSQSEEGGWNDEVRDTALALRALAACGMTAEDPDLRRGLRAIKAQYNEDEGCWWDIWDTCYAMQCLLDFHVEEEMVARATEWLLSKKYPAPENNWLNVHTTAAVLEVVAETEAKYDSRTLAARTWLEETVEARLDRLDIWSLVQKQ